MKLFSILFIFLFITTLTANADQFKVLKYDEYKKLSQSEKTAYIKEFAKRLGSVKPKRSRTSSNAQPTRLQIVLAEIIGLPLASAQDNSDNYAKALAAQQRRVKELEEAQKDTKAAPPANERERALARESIPALEEKKAAAAEIAKKAHEELEKLTPQINKVSADLRTERKNLSDLEKMHSGSADAQDSLQPQIDATKEKIRQLNSQQDQLLEKMKPHSQSLKSADLMFSPKEEEQLRYYRKVLKEEDEKADTHEAKIKEIREKNEAIEKKQKEIKVESILGKEEIDAEKKKIAQLEKDLAKEKDPNAKEEIQNLISISKNKIAKKEHDLRVLGIELKGLTMSRDNKEVQAGLKPQESAKSKSEATLNRINKFAKKQLERQKQGGKPSDTDAKTASASAGVGTPNPQSKTEDKKTDDTKKVDKNAPKEIQKMEAAEELCANAGFVVTLGKDEKTGGCHFISSTTDDRYVGKITKGKAAKATCPNKDYGPEQTVLCMPFAFGLTKDDNGVCVAPSQHVSTTCRQEAINKDTIGKALMVIEEDPQAYEAYAVGYTKMCDSDYAQQQGRSGTVETCVALNMAHRAVKEMKNGKSKPEEQTPAPHGTSGAQ